MTNWIEDLEQKAAAATDGEWVASISTFRDRGDVRVKGEWGPQAGITYNVPRPADAEFIAAANPHTVQRLLRTLDEAGTEAMHARDLASLLREERDALAAKIARVEALAEKMAGENGMSWNSISARRIISALTGRDDQ